MRNYKPIFYLYQIYKYLFFLPMLGFSTLFIFLLFSPLIFFAGERSAQITGIVWARFNSFITPMFIDIKGQENVDSTQSYVIVANHQSQFDIFAIYGWLPVDFRWVLKMELRKVPVLGYYCYKAGHVYVDRSNHDAAIASINSAKKRIKNGTSIFFFPEGTRSKDGRLLPFKKGAFKFAFDINLPILPVTINGTRRVLPANTMALFPGSAEIKIHKPIDIGEYSLDRIDELIARTRSVIGDALIENTEI